MSDVKHLDPLLERGKQRFRCIVIDPPWENRSVKRSRRYATLPAPTLAHLPLEALMHPEGCLVALWVTNRERIRRCVDEELLPALGLVCAAKWHWLKLTEEGQPVSPLGVHHRRPYETLLLCHRPGDALDLPDGRVIASRPLEHSRKPHLGALLRECRSVRDGECLEMFARELFPGWVSWGNEPLKFQAVKPAD